MRYIIDGCNFIKKFAGGSPFDFEGEKKKLLRRLERYSAGKKVEITVVFDSRFPSFEAMGSLTVIHSEDADGRIVLETEKLKSPASASVVSDDRAVRKEARALGAAAAGVAEFDRFLSKSLNERKITVSRGGEKPSPEEMSAEDIEEWENYFRR